MADSIQIEQADPGHFGGLRFRGKYRPGFGFFAHLCLNLAQLSFLPLLSAPLLGPLLAPLTTSFLRSGSFDVDVLCLGKGVLGRSDGLFLQRRL